MMEVYLNLSKVDLFGWEEAKSDRVIDSIIEGIQQSDTFPAVDIYEISPNEYEIAKIPKTGIIDGGHHRALGHFIANTPLRCRILGKTAKRTQPINIRDIVLVDDEDIIDGLFYDSIRHIPIRSYQCSKALYPDYR